MTAMAAHQAVGSGRGMGAGADERLKARGGMAHGALRGKNGGEDETGHGGALFKWHSGEQRKGGSRVGVRVGAGEGGGGPAQLSAVRGGWQRPPVGGSGRRCSVEQGSSAMGR
jgi:hypothetical protein